MTTTVLIALFAESCQSAPPAVNSPTVLALLPAGARAYFYLDVAHNRQLAVDFVGSSSGVTGHPVTASESQGLQYAIDRTYRIYGALSASHIYLIGVGDYPGFLFSIGMKQNSDWKEMTMSVAGRPRSYWQQVKGRSPLQLALTGGGTLIASDGDIATLFARQEQEGAEVAAIPDSVVNQFGNEDLVLYAPANDRASSLSERFSPSLFGQLLVLGSRAGAVPADGGGSASYDISLQVTTHTEREARTISVLLRFGLISLLSQGAQSPNPRMSRADLMRNLSFTISGSTIEVTGLTLSITDLSSLVFQFTRGSGIN